MSDSEDGQAAGNGRRLSPPARRAVIAASTGTIIEWFDYSLYGSLAAILASDLFFPNFAPGVGVLAAFATFGVAFLIRPLGGILLGRIGDRYGRKPALVISLVLMGASTFLVAFLPSFATIGIWAPILLVVLRLAQGFGAGAELAGALALTAEYTPIKRRGFYTALLQTTSLVGVLLASLAFLVVSWLPHDALLSWGWRIPFLSAGLLFAVALYLRSRLEESPEYVAAAGKVRERDDQGPRPLALLFATMKRQVLIAFILISALNVTTYTLTSFIASYLKNTVGMSATSALAVVSIGTVVGIVAGPVVGALCDRHGFRRIWLLSMALTVPGVFLFFAGLRTGAFGVALLCVSLAYLIGYAGGGGAYPGVFANLFPTEVRYTGIAAAKELSGATVAGTTPFVATALTLAGGGSPWLVAGYVALWSLFGAIALWRLGAAAETPTVPNLLVSQESDPVGRREPAGHPVTSIVTSHVNEEGGAR
ncbi:MFS transporter [Pseudonocardia xishanensis]|uniref:MFS transporter n=1 Tax=Pseudonocardia xishanensis TaxID=630995 RepID=A0ABP8RWM8_9PSEU